MLLPVVVLLIAFVTVTIFGILLYAVLKSRPPSEPEAQPAPTGANSSTSFYRMPAAKSEEASASQDLPLDFPPPMLQNAVTKDLHDKLLVQQTAK